MPAQALFGISVGFGFIAWDIVAAQYFWPLLRSQAREDALRPLLLLHSFRYIGLAFLVKGVVAPELPAAFAVPAAYGDLVAALLERQCFRASTGYVASHVLHSNFHRAAACVLDFGPTRFCRRRAMKAR